MEGANLGKNLAFVYSMELKNSLKIWRHLDSKMSFMDLILINT